MIIWFSIIHVYHYYVHNYVYINHSIWTLKYEPTHYDMINYSFNISHMIDITCTSSVAISLRNGRTRVSSLQLHIRTKSDENIYVCVFSFVNITNSINHTKRLMIILIYSSFVIEHHYIDLIIIRTKTTKG